MNLKDIDYMVLASKSPRRKELLEQIGINIKVRPSHIDETQIKLSSPMEYAATLSQLKADATAQNFPDNWVLGADTIVVVGDEILGKPQSENHAAKMLNKLNDREHMVYTAFCLMHKRLNKTASRVIGTRVEFKYCTHEEFSWYIDTKEPFDKAGAYAIQGKGAFMIKSISGSYSNVVGLPVCEVVEEMKSFNLIAY